MDDKHILIKKQLLAFSMFNLFIVACLGLLMRIIPLIDSFPLDFQNVLHGHSHFAFGGWILPILTWLIMQFFSDIEEMIAFRHWRNITMLMLFSAYGMLITFPFQGYAPASIFFSTVSVIATFYLSICVWYASIKTPRTIATRLLQAALVYAVLSSIGPFATGPLAAMGKAGTPIYYNAIYFYLHFQYNGFFSFVLFAVIYRGLANVRLRNESLVFWMLNTSCLLTFFLSVLWNHPNPTYYWLSGIGASIQIIAAIILTKNILRIHALTGFASIVFKLALFGFLTKTVLQLVSAFPLIADIAFENRNFIVAYLHLVLLGFISLCAFAFIMLKQADLSTGIFKQALTVFISFFVITQLLLVTQSTLGLFLIEIPYFTTFIFIASIPMPASVGILFYSLLRRKEYAISLSS